MRKICVVLAGVLFCTLVSANGADKPVPASSSVVVTNSNGSSLFKLYYRSVKPQKVKVSLLDETGTAIYSETLKSNNGFVRPYNLENMAKGEYTIQVEDENGKTVEKVNYSVGKVEKWIKVTKVTNELNKFVLTIASDKKTDVTIKIFDSESNEVYSGTEEVNGTFAKVYTLNNLDSFSFEVTDGKGLVKTIKY
ncbi:hypothetical protein WSM22_07500 [Cytophagales bacterium WSM2-2]|nr:hypothetical protein WSM22_07500 [Cytophagales bacterium WSM2-2]